MHCEWLVRSAEAVVAETGDSCRAARFATWKNWPPRVVLALAAAARVIRGSFSLGWADGIARSMVANHRRRRIRGEAVLPRMDHIAQRSSPTRVARSGDSASAQSAQSISCEREILNRRHVSAINSCRDQLSRTAAHYPGNTGIVSTMHLTCETLDRLLADP
jgi:hypothetical protein